MADLTRLAPTQKDQALGMMLGIPLPTVLACGVGILGSAAIQVKSGEATWLITDLFQYWPSWACALGGLAIFAVNLVGNLSANIIPPANDFMNLCPGHFRWRWCAYSTIAMACLICPFYLFHSATGFALRFLGGYGMVTGAIFGVMVSDYYFVRARELSMADLYPSEPGEGAFEYWRGHNWRAIVATLAGIALPLPGWLADLLGAKAFPIFFVACNQASWFVACTVAALAYLVACWASPPPLSMADAKQACGSKCSTASASGSDNLRQESELQCV
jgi:NCS1 family nucleobase:cation symporter-1